MKITLLAALSVLAMLMASACGAGAIPTDPAESAQAEAPLEITFLNYSKADVVPNGKNLFDNMIDQYKLVEPNVIIKNEIFAEKTSVEFLTKLDMLQLTGVTADVIHIPSYREYALRVRQGFFYPISEFVQAEGINYDSVYSYPSEIDGEYYGVPFEPGIYGVLINKDMLDAAGLPLPKEGWTWDDYADYAKKMTKGSGTNKVYGSFMHSWNEFKREGLFNVVMDNPYVKPDGSSNLDSKYFGEWLQYMYDLENKDKSQWPYSEVIASSLHYRDMFVQGKTAMIPIGTWMVDICINPEAYPHDFPAAFAPFPVFSDGKPGVTQGSASYFVVGANTTSEKAKAAYDFIRWLSGDGAVASNRFPATRDGDLISVLKAKVGDRTNMIDVQSVIDMWTSPNLVVNIIGRDSTLFSEIDAVYNAEAELFLLGSQDLETTLKNIREKGQAIIDSAR
jgi:multiple sugar transport system substrate-binding protein